MCHIGKIQDFSEKAENTINYYLEFYIFFLNKCLPTKNAVRVRGLGQNKTLHMRLKTIIKLVFKPSF